MGSKDATTTLAEAHQHAQPAIDGPTTETPCDRCGLAMLDGIFGLSRSQPGGTIATWWVCRDCNHQFSYWWHATDLRLPFRATIIPEPPLETS